MALNSNTNDEVNLFDEYYDCRQACASGDMDCYLKCRIQFEKRLENATLSLLSSSDQILYEAQMLEVDEIFECFLNYTDESDINDCLENIGVYPE